MQFVNAAGITMHYLLEGPADAPVLMFANSIGTDFRIWDAVATDLRRDYRLLRYDARGHGLTDAPPGPYTIAELADDAVALLDALDIERVHVCGLSLGGMVAQQLAARHRNRVRSAIFCDTALRIGTAEMWNQRIAAIRERGLASIVDAVLQRWFTADFLRNHGSGYRNMLARTPAEGYAACCAAIRDADLTDSAADITVSALVVVGSDDVATPPEAAAALAEALRDARLVRIDGAAHLPCLEQPQALIRALRGFLEGLQP